MTAQRDADADVDVESLRRSARRPLDAFLLVSVVLLFLSVAAVGAFVATGLRQPVVAALRERGERSQAAYKMENFAYLEATSSVLKTQTMPLDVVEHGNGTSKGPLFDFNRDHYSLQPLQAGFYFIYINLNLTCTQQGSCSSGRLTVQVGDKLACEVDLPSQGTHLTRKCWTVSRVNRQKLLTQMTVPDSGLSNWKLELKGSGLGMFLVD